MRALPGLVMSSHTHTQASLYHVKFHLPPLFLFKHTPPILMVLPTTAGESSFEKMTFGLSSIS